MLPSRVPSAQLVSSIWQVALQPSPLTLLPSSHCSPSVVMSTPSPQTPNLHTPLKQTLTAPQLDLSAKLTCWQPLLVMQLSVVHGLLSSQLTAGGAQTPPAQVSGPVQKLPSLHAALLGVWTQPLAALQLSSVHAFWSLQLSAGPGEQLLPWQVSPTVQMELSALHDVPFICAASNWQLPLLVLHESNVHKLPSAQVFGVPLTQAPLVQMSPAVHALPSLQALVLFVCVQPVLGLQLSLVHALPSSQLMFAPATQLVPVQMSGFVQTLLSALQTTPGFCAT